MKLVKIKRENGTYRLASQPEGASMTDQSDKNYLDINNIMKNYAKTGLLPQFKDKIAQYIDVTQIPSYMDAHNQISRARELFMQLPSPIRKLMDNNPANLEKVVSNPNYKDILMQYGILEKVKVVEQSDNQASQSEAAASQKSEK